MKTYAADTHLKCIAKALLMSIHKMFSWRNKKNITVEPQWLEHLWGHGNSFETWVVRATEG